MGSLGIDIFNSIQLDNPYTVGKLSIRQDKMCNFIRIGRKTEEEKHWKVQKNDISRRAYMVTVEWAA